HRHPSAPVDTGSRRLAPHRPRARRPPRLTTSLARAKRSPSAELRSRARRRRGPREIPRRAGLRLVALPLTSRLYAPITTAVAEIGPFMNDAGLADERSCVCIQYAGTAKYTSYAFKF